MSYVPGIGTQHASLEQVLDRRVFERPRKVLLDDEITHALIEARRLKRAPDAAAVGTARAAEPAGGAEAQPSSARAADPARAASAGRDATLVDVRA